MASIRIGALNLLTLDLLYSGLPHLPGIGEEVFTEHFTAALGGGPAAAAVTAARLGADVRLATSLGSDLVSRLAQELLAAEPLAWRSFDSGIAGSSVNVTSVMTFPGSDRSFVSYFPRTDFYTRSIDAFFAYLSECRICMASVSSPELFRRLSEAGCRIAFDVSWNDDLSLAQLQPVLPWISVLTPNEKEAARLTGCAQPEEALRRLAGLVPCPVVKLGARGALVWQAGRAVPVPPFDFPAVDSTGAGDAFLGGLCCGLAEGWDMARSAELGCYAGGRAASAVGCLTARCSRKEYTQLCQSR